MLFFLKHTLSSSNSFRICDSHLAFILNVSHLSVFLFLLLVLIMFGLYKRLNSSDVANKEKSVCSYYYCTIKGTWWKNTMVNSVSRGQSTQVRYWNCWRVILGQEKKAGEKKKCQKAEGRRTTTNFPHPFIFKKGHKNICYAKKNIIRNTVL